MPEPKAIMTTDQQGELASIAVRPRQYYTGVGVLEVRAKGEVLNVCLPPSVIQQLIGALVEGLLA